MTHPIWYLKGANWMVVQVLANVPPSKALVVVTITIQTIRTPGLLVARYEGTDVPIRSTHLSVGGASTNAALRPAYKAR